MKQKTTLIALGLLIIAVMLGSSLAVTASQTATQSTDFLGARLLPPFASENLVDWIRGGMVNFLFAMQSANFSNGNVMFAEVTGTNNYTVPAPFNPIISNISMTYNLANIEQQLNTYLQGTPSINYPYLNTTFLTNLNNSLNGQTTLDLYHFRRILPITSVNVTTHTIVVLYDKDKSVINAINAIKNNQTLTSQPFSGDEVFTIVQMNDVKQNVYGQYLERTAWKLPDGSYVPLLKALVDAYILHPTEVQPIINAIGIQSDMNNLTQFIGSINNTNPLDPYNITLSPAQGHQSESIQFKVGQLAINNLQIAKDNLNHRMVITNMSFAYVEHQSLGWTIYNDTNHNGIMDLGMRTISNPNLDHNGTIVPTIGNESLYRVAFDGAQSTTYSTPTTTNNVLTFGFASSNVNVTLFPIIRNTDDTAYSDQYSVSNQTINQVATTFHFSINNTDNSAQTKFDYLIGNWSNQNLLKGLSINTMYGMIYKNFAATTRTFNMQGNNTQSFGEDDNSAHFRSLHIYIGTNTPLASVSLDNMPYTWGSDGSSQQANGQSMPLLYGNMIFGTIKYDSQAFHTMIGQATGAAYLYSVSYPAFGGYSILHDPTYSMVASAVQPTSTNNSSSHPLPGFELLIFIVAVPILVLVNKRIRKRE